LPLDVVALLPHGVVDSLDGVAFQVSRLFAYSFVRLRRYVTRGEATMSTALLDEALTHPIDSNAERLELIGKLEAVNRAQAVVEFTLKGEILSANQNFLDTFGYPLEELVGQPHLMLCEEAFARSGDYADLWNALRRGEFRAGEFLRVGKSGKRIWIQASYNPICRRTPSSCAMF